MKKYNHGIPYYIASAILLFAIVLSQILILDNKISCSGYTPLIIAFAAVGVGICALMAEHENSTGCAMTINDLKPGYRIRLMKIVSPEKAVIELLDDLSTRKKPFVRFVGGPGLIPGDSKDGDVCVVVNNNGKNEFNIITQ